MDDQITASTRHVLYAVRVIVERQPLDNPWVSHKWAVHDLIPLDISAGLVRCHLVISYCNPCIRVAANWTFTWLISGLICTMLKLRPMLKIFNLQTLRFM